MEATWSQGTICRVTFYEALKDLTKHGKQRLLPGSDMSVNSTIGGLFLGGLAGGFSAYLTTPLDVIKTRMQVQGSTMRIFGHFLILFRCWCDRTRYEELESLFFFIIGKKLCPPGSCFCFRIYNGWLDALTSIWENEGLSGMFKGSIPRIMWYIPASLRDLFNEKREPDIHEITSLSVDVRSKIQKASR